MQTSTQAMSPQLQRSRQDAGAPGIEHAGDSTIQHAGDATIRLAGDSTIQHAGDATIRLAGDATIRHAGDATIRHAGDATIRHAGDATIRHAGDATIRHAGDATIRLAGDSTIQHAGDATIRLAGDSTIQHAGDATIRHAGGSGIEHDGDFSQGIGHTPVDRDLLEGVSSFAELRVADRSVPEKPIMSKEDFQSMKVEDRFAEMFFKSGGSSGDPKLSVFTYDDYHLQMRAAAYGLYAAGLDLQNDRCMNLFFAGGLYGGFVSFFTILETLKAIQYPMAGIADLEQVAKTIVSQKCNTLLGMPSYLIQLFTKHSEFFEKNQVVKKIFYAGEHFTEKQRELFHKKFGVDLIRSCGYGSVDAGPIGYQCPSCTGSIHHLYTTLHLLEIIDPESDKPVTPGEPGRVILTSLQRSGQDITRYDIGDIARLIPGDCPCGRTATRFELLGRHGDVFKIGSAFFNYAKFAQILADNLNYAGEVQLILKENSHGEEICVCLANLNSENQSTPIIDELTIRAQLLEGYDDLRHIVEEDKLLKLSIASVAVENFERATGSGKLKRIVDKR